MTGGVSSSLTWYQGCTLEYAIPLCAGLSVPAHRHGSVCPWEATIWLLHASSCSKDLLSVHQSHMSREHALGGVVMLTQVLSPEACGCCP